MQGHRAPEGPGRVPDPELNPGAWPVSVRSTLCPDSTALSPLPRALLASRTRLPGRCCAGRMAGLARGLLSGLVAVPVEKPGLHVRRKRVHFGVRTSHVHSFVAGNRSRRSGPAGAHAPHRGPWGPGGPPPPPHRSTCRARAPKPRLCSVSATCSRRGDTQTITSSLASPPSGEERPVGVGGARGRGPQRLPQALVCRHRPQGPSAARRDAGFSQ